VKESKVEPIKVVLRYVNGKVLKGFTQDFLPNKDRFHLHPTEKALGEAKEVFVKDLKAVFFVQDFAGNPQYHERKKYVEGEKPSGRKVEVTFKDGEVLVGSTLGYEPNRPGFFIFPADPRSNNVRVYAVSPAVKNVRYL
jgi:hypothetical protein